MSDNNSSNSSKGGVILVPPKQISPSKKWCFTLNNYTDSSISSIVLRFDQVVKLGFFSKEVGDSGTPHLQGYVEFIKKVRPSALIGIPEIHWEKARGSRADNSAYCSAETAYCWSKGMPEIVKTIVPDRDWEVEILKEIGEKPGDREIFWYWSKEGGIGKTSFCKYLVVHKDAIILGGKASDIRNGVVDYIKTHSSAPSLVVINIPRSFDEMYISYEGLENIKDMLFYSGKYEGGMVCGNPPHLFIFANCPPNQNKMSTDRWVIREIVDVKSGQAGQAGAPSSASRDQDKGCYSVFE